MRRRSGSAAVLALMLTARAALGVASVTGTVTAENGTSWRYGYEAVLQKGQVLLRVGIHLTAAPGVTPVELEEAKRRWKAGAEEVWNDRLMVASPDGRRHPVRLEIDFFNPRSHHEVVVRPGAGATNQLNWHLLDDPLTVAHEIGHMLGAFDEYRSGATGPEGGRDEESIMSERGGSGLPQPRHLDTVVSWFREATGCSDCVAQRVDRELWFGSAR